jgi:tRNA A-37 threonylcarbamoyl transferase component Bud32
VLKIGRYEIEAEIGRGATGVVHLAHDTRLRRRVAVKTYSLPQGLSRKQKKEFHERFLREAQAAARLSHPGIVTVYDADEDLDRNLPYIAMEYVPGKNLREILEAEGRFELDRVVEMAGVLAEALQMAHEAGIVHRDIKPANLLVRESDEAIQIADFGVAKLSSSTLTQSGTSIGSPAYMSPEQIRGRSIDGRSDLFSLAVILYELLCGERPFNGEDPTALIYSVVHETPIPITKRMNGLPAGLDAFFENALAKDPNDRYRDGQAFRQAFEEACAKVSSIDIESTVHEAAGQIEPGPLATKPPRKRLLLAAVAFLFLVCAGWLIFGGKEAHLKLDAKSGIESGELTLLVDGVEVYQRDLSAPRKQQGFLKKVLDQDLETFEAWIEIAPGKHEVVAQVLPTGATSGYRDTIVVDIEPGEIRRIKLAAGRKYGSELSLKSD